MEMEKTQRGTKKFTKEEKLGILAEAERNGVVVTLAKYELSPATYYYLEAETGFWRGGCSQAFEASAVGV